LRFEDRTEKPELLETEFCALIAKESTGSTGILPRKKIITLQMPRQREVQADKTYNISSHSPNWLCMAAI